MEYTPVSTNITFNATITTQMVPIPLIDNMIVADSTLFSVIAVSNDPAVVFHPATADVTIEDDDCELCLSRSVLQFVNYYLILSQFSGHYWIQPSSLLSS